MYFGGLKDERMKELNNLDFDLNHNSGSVREERDAWLVERGLDEGSQWPQDTPKDENN